jgi:lycopene beta-cyclase
MLTRYATEILKLKDFEIIEQESGVIPMSDFPFEKYSDEKHILIGTAGGWVKPTTGYSFKNCERNSKKLIKNLKEGLPINKGIISKKFRVYDSLFLDILNRRNEKGPELFEIMYTKFTIQKIFSFLDDETSFTEDLGIMLGFPTLPFTHSFLKYLTR